MEQDPQPTARLEAGLPTEVLGRLKRAAEIQGRTLTDFVVAAADRTIEQTEIIRLSPRTSAKSSKRSVILPTRCRH